MHGRCRWYGQKSMYLGVLSLHKFSNSSLFSQWKKKKKRPAGECERRKWGIKFWIKMIMQEPHMWKLMRGRGKENHNCLEAQWAEYSGIQVRWSSIVQPCLTLCDPMDCKTPSFPVHHKFLKLAQTHVHQVSDATQPFHPLSSPSLPALNLSQH